MIIMLGAKDGALLASVCLLLIVVLGAVQSGPASSVRYQLPGFLSSTISPPTTSQTTEASHSTTTQTGGGQGPPQTVRSTTESSATPTTQGVVAVAFGAALNDLVQYIPISVVLALGCGMVVLLLRRENPTVFDLKGLIEQMESQRSYFVRSWSRRLRNAALLRYYVLMAEVCSKVGIEDGPTETPHEFIGRASAELKVARPDQARFADAVDKAHYGAELSGDEVDEASKFMDSFTKTIAGRVTLV